MINSSMFWINYVMPYNSTAGSTQERLPLIAIQYQEPQFQRSFNLGQG